ncbi:glutamine synthetase [Erythrobacter sp. GH3-10]|uniref:Glutamine synthetase n=2 Tax=Aurantiacibacter rhizosphaerae TaxID=2691582 RepID=A0A844XGV8_9SPHN|nr:glutamine synthetase [Aurantiacibacter rhizosphaerae]
MPSAPRIAEPSEAADFLAANPQIEYVEVIFTSMAGVPRGKRVRRSELLPIYENGRFFPGSMLVIDVTGQDCEDTGLVWGNGDPDMLLRPVPGTLVKAPWLGDDVAQVITSMYNLDGSPNDLDPRHALQRVLDRFADIGLTPVVACEMEYYLVDQQRGPRGELRPAVAPGQQAAPQQVDVFSLREMQDFAPFFKELWRMADVQGIPLEAGISEYAAGQVELTLHHGPDALRAGDEALMYKRLARGLASTHGMEATFMAKPFTHSAGSSMHLHFSVNNASGENIFASEDPQGTPVMRHAIGGLRETQAEAFGIFAPNANSYRRYRANSYAPTAPIWGVNNRSVSLRVPAGPPKTRHVEHRFAGADANPYLALAAMLAGVHHGIVNEIDPGPPVEGDGYKAAASSTHQVPGNWYAAIEALDKSQVMRDYLGANFVDMYCSVKRTEQDRFFSEVTSLDYDWYLKTV